MSRYGPEYYSPDEVFPTAAQTQSGVVYGPNGDDFTGTLVAGGGSSPATPGTLIGQIVKTDESGATASGVSVSVQQVKTNGGFGLIGDSTKLTAVSDANGLIEFDGMLPGWTYAIWEGDQRYPQLCVVPQVDSDLVTNSRFFIDSLIGCPIN